MATTVTRPSLTDNVTLWDAGGVNDYVYDVIDDVLANNLVLGGTLQVDGGTVTLTTLSALSTRVRLIGAGETSAPADGGTKTATLLISDTGGGAGNGGAIELGAGVGTYAQAHFAAIKALLEDGAGNTAGALAFYTRAATVDSSLTERMRVTPQAVAVTGPFSATGVISVADGSVSAPALAFASDANTGFYRVGAEQIGVAADGVLVLQIEAAASGQSKVTLPNVTGGGAAGANLIIGRNTANPAPAVITLFDKDGTARYLWVDSTGDLRVGTTYPNSVTGDTIGTVVGTQS